MSARRMCGVTKIHVCANCGQRWGDGHFCPDVKKLRKALQNLVTETETVLSRFGDMGVAFNNVEGAMEVAKKLL